MTARRGLLFLGFFLLVPVPIIVFGGGVPVVHLVELAALCALVALREGAAGPVKMMLFLFAAEALVGAVLCWLAAWSVDRGLRRFPGRRVDLVLLAVLTAAVVATLLFDVYATPFGRAPHGNLWEVLT